MTDNVMESMVRQRVREERGQVYCADCLACSYPAPRGVVMSGCPSSTSAGPRFPGGTSHGCPDQHRFRRTIRRVRLRSP